MHKNRDKTEKFSSSIRFEYFSLLMEVDEEIRLGKLVKCCSYDLIKKDKKEELFLGQFCKKKHCFS